jgi:hypothetical protein
VQEGNVDMLRALAEMGANVNTPRKCGATPAFIAVKHGHTDIIRVLAELGANLNTPTYERVTPVFQAITDGHVGMVRTLIEHGVDINSTDADGYSSVFVAAMRNRVQVIRILVEFRVDIDTFKSKFASPLLMAVQCRHREASIFLINMGADVKQCMQQLPPRLNHIREIMSQFFLRLTLPNMTCCMSDNGDDDVDHNVKCALFSLTKLILAEGYSTSDVNDERKLFETSIATSMWHQAPKVVIERMQKTPYVLKRRLVRIAWRVYQSTLLRDGDRVSALSKTRRYTELVCFLFDPVMLGEVVSLRMTCKTNNERRRFPVCYGAYRELEANIIEEWLGCGSSRFVTTDIIHVVIGIHS